MKIFNLNDYVNIKLTETGIAILKEEHDKYLKEYAGEFKYPEIDENGYTQMQMWEVMQIFGKYMYNGNPNLPFEPNIAISDIYLKNSTTKKRI